MNTLPEEFTRRLLVEAGLGDGMRVLDIGCGCGDVTLEVASLVGPNGHVVGVDRDAASIDVARSRAAELGLSNVSFATVELDGLGDRHSGFDAITGRRVLMYQPDAAATLVRLRQRLSPNGVLVLQEHDSTGMPIGAVRCPCTRRSVNRSGEPSRPRGATFTWDFISAVLWRRWG